MSGHYGACILHVAPESFRRAARLVQTGDEIEIDVRRGAFISRRRRRAVTPASAVEGAAAALRARYGAMYSNTSPGG